MLEKTLIENPLTEYPGWPRLPWPNAQVNNTLDPKPNLQEAIYLTQMDFRKDFELSWKELYSQTQKQTFIKIIIPANTSHEVKEYLTSQGITEEFLGFRADMKKQGVDKASSGTSNGLKQVVQKSSTTTL